MKQHLLSVDHIKAMATGLSGLALSITAKLAHIAEPLEILALMAGTGLSLAGAWNYYQLGRLNRAKRKQIENGKTVDEL